MTAIAYRSVLVPLDGSAFAEQALPLATAIARHSGAILQLALVHHPVPALATALEVPEIESQLNEEGRTREATYLATVEKRVREGLSSPVTGALLDGAVADALQRHIEGSGTDLVVLTTHGRGAVSRFWLGSVADQLMRRLHLPVLLLRPGTEQPAPDTLGKVLIALDGSSFSERGLAAAVALGKPFGATYDLLMVIEPPMPIADPAGLMVVPTQLETSQRVRKAAAQYLEQQAARLRADGLVVTTHAVEGAGAAQTIMEQADALGADLIAITSHGTGGFERLVVGSVADKVIRGSSHPTLVVRPGPDVL